MKQILKRMLILGFMIINMIAVVTVVYGPLFVTQEQFSSIPVWGYVLGFIYVLFIIASSEKFFEYIQKQQTK